MKIDKVNDEFIVDCTNNTTEERQRVYKFLVDNRNYSKIYLDNNAPIIVCNRKPGDSNWNSRQHYYSWFNSKKDLPIYTFEQFKKHVLKQTEMEKEIEYYLCKKTCWGNNGTKWNKNDKLYSTNLESLPYFKEIGLINNPEFWEAIYKEEFKVGDWVTFWSEIDKKLYSSKIKEWTPRNYCKLENGLEPFKHLIKKATPEEIEKASKTIVKMYSSNKGEFEIEIVGKKAYYRPENKELTKEFIEEILDWFDDSSNHAYTNRAKLLYSLKVDSLRVGCMEGTRQADWLKVYDLIK